MKIIHSWVWRFLIALTSGIIVTGLCLYLVAGHGAEDYIRDHQYRTMDEVKEVAAEVKAFQHRTGRLPNSLSELYKNITINTESGLVEDSWRHPLLLAVQATSYEIISFGADGQLGGLGLDCDISSKNANPPNSTPSAIENLRSPFSRNMVTTSFICGSIVFGLTFLSTKGIQLEPIQLRDIILQLVLTLIATAFVSVMITGLHVPSGH